MQILNLWLQNQQCQLLTSKEYLDLNNEHTNCFLLQIVKTILAVNDEITEFKGNILDGNARRLVLKAKGNDEIILKVKYIDKEGVEKEFQINKKVQTTKSSF